MPPHATVLMLGSFPPSEKRWSMRFYYPNLQNDMWRIFGLIMFGDKQHLLTPDGKAFDQGRIEAMLRQMGIAIFDTATEVVRTKGTAADNDLEVTQATDIRALLAQLPECQNIVCTGGKAAEICAGQFGVEPPKVGARAEAAFNGRSIGIYRMPSTSRAYPLKLEKKAEAYRRMLCEVTGRDIAPIAAM